jgi:GT2 family glycosyltransferase
MKLSCIINTRNNRAALLEALDHLPQASGLPEHECEIIVVDNGSTDGTAAALARRRDIRTISLDENEGVPARNIALAQARGKFVAFLDDEIRPTGRAIPQALAHLGRHPKTAAVVARVVLPDGSADAPALPSVLMSGASIVRKSALDEVGGFAAEFFRQAADYELSFRLWRAGYRIERFEDLQFARTRMPKTKLSELACRMDLRNNLILCQRYLPRPLRHAYRRDWMRRYALLARQDGYTAGANRAIKESRIWAHREAAIGRRTLGTDAIESIFGLESQRRLISAWAQTNHIRRVCIADWGKNLFATWSACRSSGLEVCAILDPLPAFAGQRYRNVPVLPESSVNPRDFDGILLSTVNPAQVHLRATALESRFGVPVLRLWEPMELLVPPPRNLTDQTGSPIRKVDRAA